MHDSSVVDVKEIDMEKCYKDRMVELKFQPFQHLGLQLYVVGSLSCSSSYANDACFSNWTEKTTEAQTHLNNSYIEEFDPADPITVQGFISWLKACPVWLVTSSLIKYKQEFMT